KEHMKITVNDSDYSFNTRDAAMIIQARLDEMFELINSELARIDRAGKLPGGAVFVGGGSKLSGLAEYAKDQLRLPARVSHPSGFTGVSDEVNDPEYATAIGLMLADISTAEGPSHGGRESARAGYEATKKRFKGLLDRFRP